MSSRAKGLWWKEWRQLRMLRIVGTALILVAPLMLLSAAEAAKRGWVPLNAMANYSAATVVQDALPMFLAFLIWPLLAMMCVAQSYCGDIATGTEWFWMARPVRPRRVWATRLLASMLSLVGIIVVHWIVWRLLVLLWGDAGAFDAVGANTRWFLMNQFEITAAGAALWAGLAITIVAFLSALAASAFVRSPMQALMLSLMLAVLPLGLSQLLEAFFPYAHFGYSRINLAGLVPLLLFVDYVGVSYRSACKGEPAGRGRLKRALSALTIGVVAMIAIGVPTGIWATHRAELSGLVDSTVFASPTGNRFFISNNGQNSGWLFDVDSGDELLHLNPYVGRAAWRVDGARMALLRANEVGSTVIDIYDPDGVRLIEALDCQSCYRIAWAGDRLTFSYFQNGSQNIDWIDPATGERAPITFEQADNLLYTIGPALDGTTYLARQFRVTGDPSADSAEPSERRVRLLLYALGAEANWIGEPITINGIVRSQRFGELAPDGSAVLTKGGPKAYVIDLSGKSMKEIGWAPAWLRPNRPVWTAPDGEDLSILIDEDGEVRELGHFDGHGWVHLSNSPDGRRLLLVRHPRVDIPSAERESQHWLYDDETQNWTEIEQTKLNDRDGRPAKAEWVNNDTVVLRGAGLLALCEPGVPGSLRFLK